MVPGLFRSRLRALLVALVLPALLACGDGDEPIFEPPPGPWVAFEGEHITFFVRPGDEVPAERVAQVDGEIEALWDWLDLPDEVRLPIRWYRVAEQAEAPLLVEREALGTTLFSHNWGYAAAIGLPWTFEHELVHAAMAPAQLIGHSFWAESVATALSCVPVLPENAREWSPGSDLTEPSPRLVVYLLDRGGPELVLELLRQSRRYDDASDVRRQFSFVTGEDLDEVLSSDELLAFEPCIPFFTCQRESSAGGIDFDVDLQVDERLGFALSGLPSEITVTAGLGRIVACDGVAVDPRRITGLVDAEAFLAAPVTWLVPGERRFALQYAQLTQPRALAASIELHPNALAPNCSESTPIELGADPGAAPRGRLLVPDLDRPVYLRMTELSELSSNYPRLDEQDDWRADFCNCIDGEAVCGVPPYQEETAVMEFESRSASPVTLDLPLD